MGSSGWPLLAASDLVIAVASSIPMMAIATTVLAQLRHHRPLRRQRGQPLQPGNHRHERPLVLHHLERHLGESENTYWLCCIGPGRVAVESGIRLRRGSRLRPPGELARHQPAVVSTESPHGVVDAARA